MKTQIRLAMEPCLEEIAKIVAFLKDYQPTIASPSTASHPSAAP